MPDSLENRIVELLEMLGGSRSIDFLCMAFSDSDQGDIAIAVLKLCQRGRLIADKDSIRLENNASALHQGNAASAETPLTLNLTDTSDLDPLRQLTHTEAVVYATDPIALLGLSTRSSNAIERLGATNLAELIARLPLLKDQQGIGKTSIDEVEQALSKVAIPIEAALAPNVSNLLTKASQSNRFIFGEFGELYTLSPATPSQDSTVTVPTADIQHPIAELPLREAALRRLRANHVMTVEDLIELGPDGLRARPRVGEKLVYEVQDALSSYSAEHGISLGGWGDDVIPALDLNDYLDSLDQKTRSAVNILLAKCRQSSYPVFTPSLVVLSSLRARKELTASDRSPNDVAEKLFSDLESSEALLPCLEHELGRLCASSASPDAKISVPEGPHWLTAAKSLSEHRTGLSLDEQNLTMSLEMPTAEEWLRAHPSRDNEIVLGRLCGKTLQELGDHLGLTRSRAQQIVEQVLASMPCVTELKYLPLFEDYLIEEDVFCSLTGLSRSSYGYLSLIAKSRKANRRPLEEALTDSLISDEIKDEVRKVVGNAEEGAKAIETTTLNQPLANKQGDAPCLSDVPTNLLVDEVQQVAILDGEELSLTETEFKLLLTLMSAHGRALSREELLGAAFGDDSFADVRTIDGHIKNLRAKLGDDARNPYWIKTVHGFGYRFSGDSSIEEPEGALSNKSARKFLSADGNSRLTVDVNGHRVFLDESEITPTITEFNLLVALIGAGSDGSSRESLGVAIGNDAGALDSRSVDSHLKNLRKALRDDARNSSWIETIYGFGYRFIGRELEPEDQTKSEQEIAVETSGPACPETPSAPSSEEVDRLIEELTLRSQELNEQMASLGFFQTREKKAVQRELASIEARLQKLTGERG